MRKEKKRQTLCVTCKYNVELDYLTNFCEEYFGDYLDVIKCQADSVFGLKITPDAFLVTSFTEMIVKELFPDAKVFFAERSVTGQNLELLIKVPKGNEVLIVNSPKYSAIDSVNKLNKLDVRDLKLVPYWPSSGIETSDFKYVAYFGVEAYLPPGDYTTINLGTRVLALSVIFEIITYYGLPYDLADYYNKETIDRLISRAISIDEMLKETKDANINLELACNLNNNIVFSIDEKDEIGIANKAFLDFFGLNRRNVIGKNFHTIFKSFSELEKILENKTEVSEQIIENEKQKYIVTTSKYGSNTASNMLVSMISVPVFRDSENRVRRIIRGNDFTAKYTFDSILGDSQQIKTTKQFANYFAKSDATILIRGESGSGKELFAQSIHNASSRRREAFVGINFAALPESLAESELFGYDEGAFTGAAKGGKPGLFEMAHGGTIFLDEIGDASVAVQTKLLRVLEEHEVFRVGGKKMIPIDIRVICATNRDLKKMVEEGTFREDLYYRIGILKVEIPPLRNRKEDILLLLSSLISEQNFKYFIDEDIEKMILDAPWPGNARELRALAEYITVLGKIKEIEDADIRLLKNFLKQQLEGNGKYDYKAQTVDVVKKDGEKDVGDDMIAVLLAIYRARSSNKTVGRNSLSKDYSLIKIGLTEAKIKSRLSKLHEEGYLYFGKTKQGTILTERGEELIKKLGHI